MTRIDSIHRSSSHLAAGLLLAFSLIACNRQAKPGPPPPAPIPAPGQPNGPPPGPTAPKAPELPGAIAVMIENSPPARPQSGIDQADIVFELEAEGGITRFLALFYQHKAEKVGPVRSARMGFIDVASGYGVPYVHAGGSSEALAYLKGRPTGLHNIDEIYTCGGCFWRSADRTPPHNLYTKTDLIVGQAKGAGFALKPLVTFPTGEQPGGGQTSPVLAFQWGPRSETTTWRWNGSRYERSHDGKAHTVETGAQVSADNVLVLVTRYVWEEAPTLQPDTGIYHINVVGTGSGYLFRNGTVYPVKWNKSGRTEPYTITAMNGSSIPLAPGQTWVEIIKTKENILQGLP